MDKLLTTKELIQLISHTRMTALNNKPVAHKKQNSNLNAKAIYWIIVGIVGLFLIYLSLPLFLSKETVVDLVGSQPTVIAKKGQTPPDLELTLAVVSHYDFSDLKVGDYVIVYSVESDVYLEKEVTSIDMSNESFQASYVGETSDDYQENQLIGVYERDAGLWNMFLYATNSVRGILGTVAFDIVIFGVAYVLIFKKSILKDEEDSDSNE